MLDLLTKFLGVEGIFVENPMKVNLLYIKQLRKICPTAKQLQSLLRKQQQGLETPTYLNASHYYESFELYEELDTLFLSAPLRAQDPNLQSKNDSLDYFYLYSKLKIACDMTSRNIVINADYQCHLLPALLSFIETNPNYALLPGIAVYLRILQMLKSDKHEDYEALKTFLPSIIQYFESEELLLMYDYAQNFCIRRINSGVTDYYLEFLDLYKTQLENGILFRNGYLEEWDYKT